MHLSELLVRDWVRKDVIDNGRRDGVPTTTRERLAALGRENRTLREERDILKNAVTSFAKKYR